jgi:hypothetical protein
VKEKRIGDKRKKRLDWVRESKGIKEERSRVRVVIGVLG